MFGLLDDKSRAYTLIAKTASFSGVLCSLFEICLRLVRSFSIQTGSAIGNFVIVKKQKRKKISITKINLKSLI